MFDVFTLAMKFDCLFLGIFQSFHKFVTLIFDKVAAPLNICLKKYVKSVISPF